MKGVFASLLLLSLILASSITASTSTTAGLAAPRLCGSKCASRCARAGMKDRCFKYCGICCRECKCVPSGTFGNKHECPCYRDKINSKGNPKCP